MDELKNVLYKYKHDKNSDSSPTHTIIPNDKSKIPEIRFGYSLTVNDNDINEFNEYMNNLFFKEKVNIPLTESFGEKSPLILDLDMMYENAKNKDRYYTNETIEKITEKIWENINYYFETNDKNSDECWITEKQNPKYIEKDDILKVKDGLHIIFPNIIGDTKVFKEFIRTFSENDELSNDLEKIFKETCKYNSGPSNSISKIMDGNVQRWFTYGCGKEYPYLLTQIIDCKKMKKRKEINYTNKDITKKICLLNKFEQNINYKNEIDNILRVKLSNSNSVSTFDMLNVESSDEDDDYDPYFEEENSDEKEASISLMKMELDNINDIVLNCLSVERANEYEPWIKVGMCLKHIGGETLFQLYNKFSQKSSSYVNENECRKYWDGFKREHGTPLTIGSLHFWAKLDNYDAYMLIREKNLKKKLEDSIFKGGHHDDIAEVVAGYYKDQFICIDLKDSWFYFNGSKWIPCSKGYRLHKNLSGRIKEMYYKKHQEFKRYKDECESNDDLGGVQMWEGREKAAYKIYESLKNVTFNKNIMDSCKLKFYVEKIMEKMDSDTTIIGFDNCVFDLQENILREGRPSDYISMTTKLDMPINQNELPMTAKEFSEKIKSRVGKYYRDKNNNKQWDRSKWDNDDTKFYKRIYRDIQKFFKQILPDTEIRKYCLRFIASRLSGDVLEQRFSIWTGSGGNGKSILIDLIRATMGEYCINLPVTLLTQKRKASNAASPEKARTRGVRFCYMQEPDSNERINAGEMKELSGGDMIQARKLYSDVFEFKPQFEIVLMCNEKPTIDDKTNGAWRRVQVYPFISRFVDDKSIINDENHVYPRDKKLTKKLESWPIIFMSMLLNEWVSMGGELDEDTIPDKIRMETENYKNQNDVLGQWISEDLIQYSLEDGDELTTFNELYGSFDTWYQENYSNGKLDKIDIKNRLIDWQNKSKWGFADGINGNIRYPKFNLKPREEL
jgi:P4 family phage/plasmid primase-like protien